MPFAEELTLGLPLPQAPEITIDHGVAAQYQAIIGDSLRMPLSSRLSQDVAGVERIANPALVLQIAIGQSTVATRRVLANLFYRDVLLHRQVPLGSTLSTVVTPLATQRTTAPGRAKVLLGIRCHDETGASVADFQRLALIPVRKQERLVEEGEIGTALVDRPLEEFESAIPAGWDLGPLPASALPESGFILDEKLADTVSNALELVRLTQNLAAAHRDSSLGLGGRRLVYGGHTIGLAQAAVSRSLPGIVTVLGWRSCDHLAPVFEGTTLRCRITVVDSLPVAQGSIVGLRCLVAAERDDHSIDVLDWRPVFWFKEA